MLITDGITTLTIPAYRLISNTFLTLIGSIHLSNLILHSRCTLIGSSNNIITITLIGL